MKMKVLPVGEFKARFSEILKNIQDGEEVAISFGKKKEKIAVLVPYSTYIKKKTRKLGLLDHRASFAYSENPKITEDELLHS